LLSEKFAIFGAKWSVIVSFFPTRSEVNLKNRWTQLSNRSSWEVDIQREKRQLIQALDQVISGASAPPPLPLPMPPVEEAKECSGSEFTFESFAWEDGEPHQDDFFSSF
jgi:hypothetical protein